ncbi:hypothetical protein [Clostridium sp.]|uniref:hypothetical protein n=1 Tax=Clostridium sp. TaxID=1506 RepID=UPI001A5B1601|nr:hypothetical protein [Clostridium sp.]MBK5234037.1 hypothetical protein [Clostridium sp.]
MNKETEVALRLKLKLSDDTIIEKVKNVYDLGMNDDFKIGIVICESGYWVENGKQKYSEIERTYTFSSNNKHFIHGMGGNSIFSQCLGDENDRPRLDWYVYGMGGKDWGIVELFRIVEIK